MEWSDIMFCPKCKCEYRPGFTECSDCHIPLVFELPQETKHEVDASEKIEYIEYEFLLSTYNYADIALIKSAFEAEKIVYFIQGEDMGIAPGGLPARVLVKKEQIEEAKELLQNFNLSFTLL